MATWTAPKTWANAAVTASEFNTHIRDNETWLKGAFTQLNVTSDAAKAKITPALMGARAYKAADQSISNATNTLVNYDTEVFDSDAFHDNVTNNTRFTIPASSAGYYICGAAVLWASNVSNRRVLWLQLNGTASGVTIVGQEAHANVSGGPYLAVVTLYQFAVADYIETMVHQNSGGSLALTAGANAWPAMWIHRISST